MSVLKCPGHSQVSGQELQQGRGAFQRAQDTRQRQFHRKTAFKHETTEGAFPCLPACCQHIASALENAAHLLCGCSWQLDLDKKRELKQSSEEDELPASNTTFFFFFSSLSKQYYPSKGQVLQTDTVSTNAFSRKQLLLLSSPLIEHTVCREHNSKINLSMTSASSGPCRYITLL